MARTRKSEPIPPAPVSQELLDLCGRVLEAPYKYRLTDLDTGTIWALTTRYGRLVPEVEVVCGQPVMMPMRAEGPDGLVGDGAITLWPNDPRYAERKAELDRLEQVLKTGRKAHNRRKK